MVKILGVTEMHMRYENDPYHAEASRNEAYNSTQRCRDLERENAELKIQNKILKNIIKKIQEVVKCQI